MSEATEQVSDGAKKESSRSWFNSEMPWAEAREKAKEDLAQARKFDRRGLLLGKLLIALGLACLAFSRRQALGDIGLAFATFIAIVASPWLIWKFIEWARAACRYSQLVPPGALAGVVGGGLTGALALAGADTVAFACASVVAGGGVGGAIGVSAVAGAGARAGVGALAVAGSFAVAGAGVGAFAVAGGGVGAVAVALVLALAVALAVDNLQMRSLRSHVRAERNEKHISSSFLSPSVEPAGVRNLLRTQCRTLMDDPGGPLTLGLAGRRGLGKTNLLRLLLKNHVAESEEETAVPAIEEHKDLKNPDLVARHRVRTTGLFVHAPTDFGEMSFLTALLEQLAQNINQRLSELLPDVRPYEVEHELKEKRRRLQRVHWLYAILTALAIIATGWSYWQSGTPDPLLAPLRSQTTSMAAAAPKQAPSRLYRAMGDSLAEVLEPRLQRMEDSLETIEQLLNPRTTTESWNSKGNMLDKLRGNNFLVGATWDSLRRTATGPLTLEMDSIHMLAVRYRQRLDSIAAVEAQYEAAHDSLQVIRAMVEANGASWWPAVLFYGIVIGFPAAFGWIWFNTQEGTKSFQRQEYDAVRDEIALYERTEELLERLKYHMTFGEQRQASVEPPGWLDWAFKLSGQLSRQVTRTMRPYTILSLVEEYRKYIQDVRFYLNHALEDERVEEERVRIVIAIDELDKVLDTERLHEMLKSLKAVFEIEDVCYLISISEDALGTYRLRHMQTKNEVDSAFTHIFNVPPMDARASLRFYKRSPKEQDHRADERGNRPLPPELLPLAIVLGGGVPRDMHRLSQMLHVRTAQQSTESEEAPSPPSPDQLLGALYKEDQDAASNLLRQDDCLGAPWRQSLIANVRQPHPASVEEAENRLEALQQLDAEVFKQENACSGDAAQQAFHRIQLMLYGMVVKGYVYHLLSSLPSPNTTEDVKDLLTNLEPLRAAIFDLANDPLGVWERLKSNPKVD